jgi:cell wall assembly regulator SMI1
MGIQKVWTEIVDWLSANAPVTARTIRAPAPEALIRSFEEAAPNGWPKDLSTLYRLFDGAEPSTAGYIFPNYRPLPMKEAGKTRQMMLDIWARVGEEANAEDERGKRSPLYLNLRAAHEAYGGGPVPTHHKPYDPARAEAEEAGTRVSMFIPSFLPVADDGSGDFLFVDLRKGRQHGCVSEYFCPSYPQLQRAGSVGEYLRDLEVLPAMCCHRKARNDGLIRRHARAALGSFQQASAWLRGSGRIT